MFDKILNTSMKMTEYEFKTKKKAASLCLASRWEPLHEPILCNWSLSKPPESVWKSLSDIFKGFRKRPVPWNGLKKDTTTNFTLYD